MLIVMHHGYLQRFTQHPLDIKTFRGPDIFQVDSPKGGLQCLDDLYETLGILLIDLDIEYIDVSKYLEQYSLSLHDRFRRFRPDIPQSQHRRPIADHGHEVALGGILINIIDVFMDLLAGFRDT